jgi:hypothetical protein
MLKCETLKRIGFFTYKYDYFKDITLKQLNMLDKPLAIKLIKDMIIKEYNKNKNKELPDLESSDFSIEIDSKSYKKTSDKTSDKTIDHTLLNSIVINVIDNFEIAIRKEQLFRNSGNKRLGTRGKNTIDKATKFAIANNSNNTPLYAKLRRIIKEMPLYKMLIIPKT